LREDLITIQRGEADDTWGWINDVPVAERLHRR
jgi:hypothetical protein